MSAEFRIENYVEKVDIPRNIEQEVCVRYRRQPEDDNSFKLLLTKEQTESLCNKSLLLRVLVEYIQSKIQWPVSSVNTILIWNFTTGMYEMADLSKVVEPTHVKNNLIDIIFVWCPYSDNKVSSDVPVESVETTNQLQAVKDLIREMLKVPAFQNSHQELQNQIIRNFGKDAIEEQETTLMAGLSGSPNSPTRKEQLDFAFLYSNPLVMRIADGGVKSLQEPVNFSHECNKIIEALEEKEKRFDVEIECATQRSFIRVLRRKPKILHIMSHGSFDTKKNSHMYYLEFEGENGEQFKLTEEVLEKDLKKLDITLDFVELAFVNSCHSEVEWCYFRKWVEYF